MVLGKTNLISSLRNSIDKYLDEKDMSIRELSEKADIPFESLKGVLYNTKREDCNLSTLYKLSKATGYSIDELICSDAMSPDALECLSICRDLPKNSLRLVRHFIKHQKKLNEKHSADNTILSVMVPPLASGRMQYTNVMESLVINHLSETIKAIAYLGIKIPCENYMPYYAEDEILLIASDREAVNGERCVVVNNGRLFIVTKQSYIENGQKKWRYVSLLNNKIVMPAKSVDEKLGYIVGFLNPDGSWGIR
jgi:hypothetical protein